VTLLEIEDLHVEYRTPGGAVRAVDGASFNIPGAAIVGLVGESGCGKTTVARALTRVIPKNARITSGRMMFAGKDLLALSPAEMNALRWRDISFIPQSAMNSLDPVYRIRSQLAEVLCQRGGLSRKQAMLRAAELFEMVGIDPKRLSDFPHQFSGGMRQRAAIALALALDPALVIADEPVTALDVIVQRQILDQLLGLQRDLGLSVIMVTHDISVVAYACDYVVVMYAGQVIEAGPTRTVLTAPGHPYTMGLYNAFPDLQASGGDLTPIEGYPPDLRDPPSGCRFAGRCPFAIDQCRSDRPMPRAIAVDHSAACHRLDDVEDLRAQAREVSTWSR